MAAGETIEITDRGRPVAILADLRGFVTYDDRLTSAATGRGLRVIQPG